MPTVCATADVQAPAQEIFDFLADYRNIPRVQPQFATSKLVTESERCVGATVALTGRFHGVPMHVKNRIITYAPPYRLASISEGAVLSRNVWELKPLAGDGHLTEVTLTIDYKIAGPFSGLFTGVASSVFNREIQAMTDESLRRLRGFFRRGEGIEREG